MRRNRLSFWVVGIVVFVLILPYSSFADKTSVKIEAPAEAEIGDVITISVHVVHDGNSFFHFTDWVYLRAGDEEIGRWDFSADNRPESETFTRQVKYHFEGPVTLVAQGNCNLHGSEGPDELRILTATHTVDVADEAPQKFVLNESGSPPVPSSYNPGAVLGSLVVVLGILNLFFLFFQLVTGMRWVKVKFGVHKKSGLVFFGIAMIHAVLGLLLYF